MMPRRQRLLLAHLLLPLALNVAHAQLRGHGGPVRAAAVSADGAEALSGSFDTSAIRWSLQRNVAEQVMRFHDAAVNAVAWLPDRRLVTAGADGKIAIWTEGKAAPDRTLDGHAPPVAGLAVSPDGGMLASASWDHTVRLWPIAGGAARVLEGHTQNVNGVVFTADGRAVVSAGYDATLRIWPRAGGAPLPAGVSARGPRSRCRRRSPRRCPYPYLPRTRAARKACRPPSPARRCRRSAATRSCHR